MTWSRKGYHFRTHRGTRILTSERQHRWMHARLAEGDPAGNHSHYYGDEWQSRHAIDRFPNPDGEEWEEEYEDFDDTTLSGIVGVALFSLIRLLRKEK